jgi:hypothetical protein
VKTKHGIDGPGKEAQHYTTFNDVAKEDCPQKCTDIGDHFINVAVYSGRMKQCKCWADATMPPAEENGEYGSLEIEFMLLPGKKWWTQTNCIDKENDPVGYHYYGTHSVASSGKPCIPWIRDNHYNFFYFNDEGDVHDDDVINPAYYFTDKEISACRNPTKDPKGPYCFTDPTVKVENWNRASKKLEDHSEYCDIPAC